MKRIRFGLGILGLLAASILVYFVFKSENALVVHPKGLIARHELALLKGNFHLMLIIVIPTIILLFTIAWRYRASNTKAKYDPEKKHRAFVQALLWIIPSVIITVMIVHTWTATHQLDPRRPILSNAQPLKIQVVALDWKWLFIYPEQGIATVNFLQIPARTPIQFALSSDGSPMNSFWIPQLSGQIYTMTGMTTTLHVMADEIGVYSGRAAEINGEGLANMTFIVKSTSQADFDVWVESAKQSNLQLTDPIYNELIKPSQKNPITVYSYVEKDFYNKIIMKYMSP